MTFNEKLKQALIEEHNERVSTSSKPHRFSPAYRLWKHKMLKDLRRSRSNPYWTLQKARRIVITVFAVVIVLLLTTACMIAGLTIGRFSFDDKREYSKLFIADLSSDKTSIEEYYGLPAEDGWTITNYDELTYLVSVSYKRGDKAVTLKREVIHGNMGHVNTENAVVEPMSLYEENDGFFIALQGGSDCVLYWIYDGYLFNISGNLNKSELVNLAHSTKIVDF